jgi:hypothetical protein
MTKSVRLRSGQAWSRLPFSLAKQKPPRAENVAAFLELL